MKKLIPAICMLLVSACLLGTSTYAWFSMNKTVSATGMSVTASTPASLMIQNADAQYWDGANNQSGFGFVAKAKTSSGTLNPTSTSNGTSWWHATAAATNSSNKDTNDYTDVTATLTTGNYALLNTFTIKYDSTDTSTNKTLYVKSVSTTVSGSAKSENLNKSIRVLFVLQDGNKVYYAPSVNGNTAAKGVDSATTTADIKSGTSSTAGWAITGATETIDTNILSATIVGGNVKTLSVYIYFDGEDSNLFSDNTLAGLDTINVEFSLGIN